MPGFGTLRRLEPKPQGDGSGGFHCAPAFSLDEKIRAVVVEHRFDGARSLALFQVQQRGIVGQSFEQPVVLIAGGGDHVAPPLVRDFMRVQHLGEEQLLILLQRGDGPVFRSQVGQRGKINQAGESLPESTRHGRYGQRGKRRRSEARGHEFESRGDVGGELAQTRRRTAGHRDCLGELHRRLIAAACPGRLRREHDRLPRLRRQRRLQAAVSAHLDGLLAASDTGPLVHTQVESHHADPRGCSAPGGLPFTLRGIGNYFARRDQIEVLGIAERHIESGELQSAARVPVAARSDRVHLIAGVGDDGSLMMELELISAGS